MQSYPVQFNPDFYFPPQDSDYESDPYLSEFVQVPSPAAAPAAFDVNMQQEMGQFQQIPAGPDAAVTAAAAEFTSFPVEVPTVIDLNKLYKEKCVDTNSAGIAPWQNSIFCNLGQNGAIGRLINSIRFTQGTVNEWKRGGVLDEVLNVFAGIDLALQTYGAWSPFELKNISPLIKAFNETYKALETKVRNNYNVSMEDFDAVAQAAINLLQLPIVRDIVGTALANNYNVLLLDLNASNILQSTASGLYNAPRRLAGGVQAAYQRAKGYFPYLP